MGFLKYASRQWARALGLPIILRIGLVKLDMGMFISDGRPGSPKMCDPSGGSQLEHGRGGMSLVNVGNIDREVPLSLMIETARVRTAEV